jgi:hypothetical protein
MLKSLLTLLSASIVAYLRKHVTVSRYKQSYLQTTSIRPSPSADEKVGLSADTSQR